MIRDGEWMFIWFQRCWQFVRFEFEREKRALKVPGKYFEQLVRPINIQEAWDSVCFFSLLYRNGPRRPTGRASTCRTAFLIDSRISFVFFVCDIAVLQLVVFVLFIWFSLAETNL